MNNKTRNLLNWVCRGNIRLAQEEARILLNSMTAQKDEIFKADMLKRLDKGASLNNLPPKVEGILTVEDTTEFPLDRFILRTAESEIADRAISVYKAASSLSDLGISYAPALMLYGLSGGGKTMLAKYIAHKVGLPFAYIRFSNLVDSLLGGTQKNLANVFDYVKDTSCVLCLDEIDAIGMARGQSDDVGEMNRIVISIMQEMDALPNNAIVIGTTNRQDRLDKALLRRFPISHEVLPFQQEHIQELAQKFFASANYAPQNGLKTWCESKFHQGASAATVISECIEELVSDIIAKQSV